MDARSDAHHDVVATNPVLSDLGGGVVDYNFASAHRRSIADAVQLYLDALDEIERNAPRRVLSHESRSLDRKFSRHEWRLCPIGTQASEVTRVTANGELDQRREAEEEEAELMEEGALDPDEVDPLLEPLDEGSDDE
ncbi:MAG: hypothetical protein ACRDNE_13405 [Gaiellaceae bacterium]